MTQTIIVSHMKGQINARNMNFKYLNKEYIGGAEFEVVLKKKKD